MLAVLWTWPAAIAGGEWLVGRHFDLPGTVWFISAAPRLGLDGVDPLTSWPAGAAYSRLDSWILLVLGSLFGWIGEVRLHGLLQVLGVFGSAWAAEACARGLGARPPWSWLAGLSFGFGGIAATALLEGHVYHLFDPWLPLFTWAWWRATGPGGTPRQGAVAGALWVLCLLTTAYVGLAASLIAVGLALGALLRRHLAPRAALAAAAVAVPVGLLYLTAFSGGDLHAGMELDTLRRGSADLVNLVGPTLELDRNGNSLSPSLHAGVFALVLVSPVVLRGRQRWQALAWTAVAGVVLALGPALSTPRTTLIPLPLSLVDGVEALQFLRFPARLIWTWNLCAGLVAALVATELARRHRLGAALLGVIALVDVFWVIDMPGRQRTQLAATPSAYTEAGGAVLDLYPEYLGPVGDWNTWFTGLSCLYQVEHGHPIVQDCVATDADASPALALSREVTGRLLRQEPIEPVLEDWQIAAVAWHPDLFTPGDRERLRPGLLALDPDPVVSTDGGEHVVLHRRGRP